MPNDEVLNVIKIYLDPDSKLPLEHFKLICRYYMNSYCSLDFNSKTRCCIVKPRQKVKNETIWSYFGKLKDEISIERASSLSPKEQKVMTVLTKKYELLKRKPVAKKRKINDDDEDIDEVISTRIAIDDEGEAIEKAERKRKAKEMEEDDSDFEIGFES